jgi:two-component system OmpR family sensor kinase
VKLSISARSFLLVLAALVVAEGIGLALFITRPPLRKPPVLLVEVAELLRQPEDGPPPQMEGGPGPPRPEWDRGRPPPEGDPPRGPPPPRAGGPPDGGPLGVGPPPRDAIPPGSRLVIADQPDAPAPLRRLNPVASTQITRELSARLGVAAENLLVQMPVDPQAPREPPRIEGRRMLGEGFSIARRLANGHWRVITHPPEGFPNAFQRQALALLAIGLALLLPLAWLFARALAAPIRGFARAAQRLGQDPGAPPLPSTGPSEMRDAVDAFNTMQTRINRMLRERTLMFGAIAHDLRTPLTRLAFRLEDLPEPLNQKVAADIQEMKTMITAALEFIRERETAGPRERLDLRSLLDRIVDDLADLGHDVSFNAGTPVILTGDPLALRRMLVNLVENALKYGDRARLRLQVEAAAAVVEIDDDGPGIPQGQQQQVFEPFFRLENSRNRDTGGMGLGLATARAIVLDHGGDIALANRSGGGLRVTVRLPMTE